MKKCLIVYYSYHHGNTKKVAEAMAEASGADCCPIEEVNNKNLNDYEVIGLGSGIAYHKHYKKLFETAEKMDLKGKNVFVFSTSGTGAKKDNMKLIEQVKSSGANVIGDFICKGFDTMVLKFLGGISKSHPNDEDISNAKKFVLELVK